MEVIEDVDSIGAALALTRHLGRRIGGSTGTNFVAVARLSSKMAASSEASSIVSLLCDGGERYASTYFNPEWLGAQQRGVEQADQQMQQFLQTGHFGV